MQTLGKTVTAYIAKNHKGYLAISSIGPAETTNDLFNPALDTLGGFPYTPITGHRVAYMDGVLNGTITEGNVWAGFYLGDITAYTANYPARPQRCSRPTASSRTASCRHPLARRVSSRRPFLGGTCWCAYPLTLRPPGHH